MKIVDTSKKQKRIVVTGEMQEPIDPEDLTKRLGATFVAKVDGPLGGLHLYNQRQAAIREECKKGIANLREIAAQVTSGETVSFRPRGHSMTGKVNDGDAVTVAPLEADTPLKKGCVVLVGVNGKIYLHSVKAVGSDGRFQIGNNKGGSNGWVKRDSIHGIMTGRAK